MRDQGIMGTSESSLKEFLRGWHVGAELLDGVARHYPFRSTRYYAGLIGAPGDPIWRQVVPDAVELEDRTGWEDPLNEEHLSPVPNLVHRYRNRVLWLVSSECAVHCRFCTRKRRWQNPQPLTEEGFQEGLKYIAAHREIRDVLLSGGDPLLLPLPRLEAILRSLRQITHVEVIRIGSRLPCVLPHGITTTLTGMLARYHPIYLNLHFNHPRELTPEANRACHLLADAGIPLGSQTVLLRGVNDQAEVLGELFQSLLRARVRPYYLMQMDLIQSAAHFRTPILTGLEILAALRNRISGMAIPHYVVDLPGGRGKVPLLPNSVERIDREELTFRDYRGEVCSYPLLPGEHEALARWLRRLEKPASAPPPGIECG